MSEAMQEYEVMIAGLPHTVLLDKATAERLGLKATNVKAAAAPANKARTADTK